MFIDSLQNQNTETRINGSLTGFLPVMRVCSLVLSRNCKEKAFSSNMFERADCYSSSMRGDFKAKTLQDYLNGKTKKIQALIPA